MRSNGGCGSERRSQSAIGVVCCNPAGDFAFAATVRTTPRCDRGHALTSSSKEGELFGAGLRDRNQPW